MAPLRLSKSVFYYLLQIQKFYISRKNLHIIVRRTPNAETAEALKGFDRMVSDREAYKRYDSFGDLLKEVTADA